MAFNWWCETTGVEIFICASPVETHIENAVIFEDGKCDDDDLDGQFVNENNCFYGSFVYYFESVKHFLCLGNASH